MALRETIINAVCHRNYFEKGANVMVEVFADRVEITNPGGLPSDLSPGEFGTKSVARNPVIASLLQRADYIERIGTGINRIRDAVSQADGCSVEFSFSEFFTVTFSFASIGGLNGRLNREIPKESEGSGRLNGRLNDDVGGLNGGQHGTLADELGTLAGELGTLTGEHGSLRQDLPSELLQEIDALGQRPGEKIRPVLKKLCHWKALTANELTEILGRTTSKSLKREHLKPMIDAGELAYTYPEMEKHPQQAYQAK